MDISIDTVQAAANAAELAVGENVTSEVVVEEVPVATEEVVEPVIETVTEGTPEPVVEEAPVVEEVLAV